MIFMIDNDKINFQKQQKQSNHKPIIQANNAIRTIKILNNTNADISSKYNLH